jgi:hypothetical protein
VAWDWRTRTAERLSLDSVVRVSLEREDWNFYVLVPILPSGLAVIGDITKYATAGDARIEIFNTASGVRLVVKGERESVTIVGWAEAAPISPDGAVHHDATTGVWTMTREVPSRGWTSINIDGESVST